MAIILCQFPPKPKKIIAADPDPIKTSTSQQKLTSEELERFRNVILNAPVEGFTLDQQKFLSILSSAIQVTTHYPSYTDTILTRTQLME